MMKTLRQQFSQKLGQQLRQQLYIFVALFSFAILSVQPVLASGNDGASAATGNIAKLEPFVVNLAAYEKFLQTTITLQLDAPEIGEKIKMMMPKVRHTVIVTLSAKEADEIRTSEGKKALMKELKTKINKVIGAKLNEGVSEVFFENFIIQ